MSAETFHGNRSVQSAPTGIYAASVLSRAVRLERTKKERLISACGQGSFRLLITPRSLTGEQLTLNPYGPDAPNCKEEHPPTEFSNPADRPTSSSNRTALSCFERSTRRDFLQPGRLYFGAAPARLAGRPEQGTRTKKNALCPRPAVGSGEPSEKLSTRLQETKIGRAHV